LARLQGGHFASNLNGTDLVPALLGRAPIGARLFLYGGRPEVCAAAAQRIGESFPNIHIVAALDGYAHTQAELSAALTDTAPDIVLVALGNPLQEDWIAQNSKLRPRAVFIGVGALFDFLADETPRAPRALRFLRLEWLFRLLREPSRLWRRYTIEIGFVTLSLLWDRFRRPAT
jgi:beta-1,4-glucosyltransferase